MFFIGIQRENYSNHRKGKKRIHFRKNLVIQVLNFVSGSAGNFPTGFHRIGFKQPQPFLRLDQLSYPCREIQLC